MSGITMVDIVFKDCNTRKVLYKGVVNKKDINEHHQYIKIEDRYYFYRERFIDKKSNTILFEGLKR